MIQTADGLLLPARPNPGVQPAGLGALYARTELGRTRPFWRGAGTELDLVDWAGSRARMLVFPGAATGLSAIGCATTTSGTGTTRSTSTGTYLGGQNRTGYVSAATAGSRATVAHAAQRLFLGTAVSGRSFGGFSFSTRFAVQANQSGSIAFAGLMSTNGPGATAGPSGIANHIGMWKETGDSEWSIQSRAAGAVTKVPLGAAFPATTANVDLYRVDLFCPSGSGTEVWWQVLRENTGGVASGSITTNLPTGNLGGIVNLSNNATAAAVGLDFCAMAADVDTGGA